MKGDEVKRLYAQDCIPGETENARKVSEEDDCGDILLRERLTRALPLDLKNAQIAEGTDRPVQRRISPETDQS
jgi:hypothetical protein